MDTSYASVAPDGELDNTRALGEWHGLHTGPDEARREWERFVEPWESVYMEVEELIDGGDLVVSRRTGTLRGRDGIEVTARNNWIWEFRGGKIVQLATGCETTKEALEAAGLPE